VPGGFTVIVDRDLALLARRPRCVASRKQLVAAARRPGGAAVATLTFEHSLSFFRAENPDAFGLVSFFAVGHGPSPATPSGQANGRLA
jgi:hypothetical protein